MGGEVGIYRIVVQTKNPTNVGFVTNPLPEYSALVLFFSNNHKAVLSVWNTVFGKNNI